jgi:hypothetical protein
LRVWNVNGAAEEGQVLLQVVGHSSLSDT